MRPSFVEVDLGAIRHNVRTVADLVAPAQVCAVVKADAYGHGDVPVASTALASGATSLAVALVEEGVRLREAGIDAPILLLSEPVIGDAPAVVEWGITPTVYGHRFVDALAEVARRPFDVHLKVDTGMHRVGAAPDEAVAVARRIAGHRALRLAGVWTHFAVADEDPVFTTEQAHRFGEVVGAMEREGIEIPVTHLSNTAGSLLHHGAVGGQMVRLGLGMYGLYPCEPAREVADLRPAMRVVSRVGHLRRLPAGARPSYGRRRPMARAGRVATVPIGYADGVPRLLSASEVPVLIGGRRFLLAGTVTMDQIVVDVDDAPVEVGDEVVLIGRQGDEVVGADDWARAIGTISYEIVCGMGPRLPRRYTDPGTPAR